jgi:hypothetical protein
MRHIVAGLTVGAGQFEAVMEANRSAVGDALRAAVLQEIGEIPGIGQFLLPRTKVQVTYTGEIINVLVSGMNEGEAGFPGVSGGEPHAEHNLWEWHEAGQFKVSGDKTTVTKDSGGAVSEVREGTNEGPSSPYRGAVRQAIEGLSAKLAGALQMVVTQAGGNAFESGVERGSGGRVKVSKSAAGVVPALSTLASAGVVNVTVSKTGQILVIGEGGRFMSPSALGIPTRIST